MSSSRHADVRTALVAFSGFGEPPQSLWRAPGYAVSVTLRRRALKQGLLRERARGSAEVRVYEAALRTANDAVVRNGFLLVAAAAVLGTMLIVALSRVLGLHVG